jgi:hypothetical protein
MGSAMAGTKAVSRSRAGRVGPGLRASSAESKELPREYAAGGILAGNPASGRVDVHIAGTTDGGLGDQQRIAQAGLSFLFSQ